MSILPVFPTTGSAFHRRRTAAGSGFALSPTDPPAMAFASRYLPSLVGRFSDAVVQTSGVVRPMAAVTAQLLLAICLLLVLLLGAHDGEFLWKPLPLIGYFLLAAAAGVCHTYLEISAGLNADAGLFELGLPDLYGSSLLLSGRGAARLEAVGAASGALLHILLSALWSFMALPLASAAGDWLGTTLFLLAAALLLFSYEQPLRRTSLFLCAVAGGFICVLGRDPIQRKRDLLSTDQPGDHAAGGVSPCILRDPVRLCRCAVRRAGGDGALCAKHCFASAGCRRSKAATRQRRKSMSRHWGDSPGGRRYSAMSGRTISPPCTFWRKSRIKPVF